MSEPIRCPGNPKAPLELCYWCAKFDAWPFRHRHEVWIEPPATAHDGEWECGKREERRKQLAALHEPPNVEQSRPL